MKNIKFIIIIFTLFYDIALPQNILLNKLDEYIKNKFISDISIIDSNNILLVSDDNLIKVTPEKIFRYELYNNSTGPLENYLQNDSDFKSYYPFWTRIYRFNNEIFLLKYFADTTDITILHILNDSIYYTEIEKKQTRYYMFKDLFADSSGNIYAYVTFFDNASSSNNIFDVVYKFSDGLWEEIINIKSKSDRNAIINYNYGFYLVEIDEINYNKSKASFWEIKGDSLSFIEMIDTTESINYFNTLFDGENIYLSNKKSKIIIYNISEKTIKKIEIAESNFYDNAFIIYRNIFYTVCRDKLIKCNFTNNYLFTECNYLKVPTKIKEGLKMIIYQDKIYIIVSSYDFQDIKKNVLHFDLNKLNEIELDSLK